MNQTVIPQLRMSDAKISLPFYCGVLGFSVDWQHQFEENFPLFVQISRAGQTIFLTEHIGDCQVGGAVYFLVDDAQACYEEFTRRGLVGVAAPQQMEWDSLEFSVTDPDGNRLRFASDIE